jgi:hypothetical protein
MTNHIIDALERIARHLAKSRVEPRVKQKCDRNGNRYWRVYDPISGSHCSLNSEQEVRAWLDTWHWRRSTSPKTSELS